MKISMSVLKQMKDASGYVVYVWWRGEKVLYVGQTNNLLCRIDRQHPIATKPLDMDDILEVIPVVGKEEAYDLESSLILKHKPPYNGVNARRVKQWFESKSMYDQM